MHDIKGLATQAKIPYLVHFTHAPNLHSIFEHGIYPVARQNELPVRPLVNDLLRLDGYRNANCISIGFPNYRMFYSARMNASSAEWAVLKLDASILWTKKCAFCRRNAASSEIRRIPLQELTTPEAFARMYSEIEGLPSRATQQLWSYDPTDVQAEVLVFEIIEPTFIREVVFNTPRDMAKYKNSLGSVSGVSLSSGSVFFSSRESVRGY